MDFVQNKGFNLTLNFMIGTLNLSNKVTREEQNSSQSTLALMLRVPSLRCFLVTCVLLNLTLDLWLTEVSVPCRMTSKLTQEEESKTIILLDLKATVWQLMLSQQRKTGLKSLTETTKTLMSMAT